MSRHYCALFTNMDTKVGKADDFSQGHKVSMRQN